MWKSGNIMNINTNFLPDIEQLHKLANEHFRSLPNEFPKDISLNPDDHPNAKAITKSLIDNANTSGALHTFDISEVIHHAPISGLGISSPFAAINDNTFYELPDYAFNQEKVPERSYSRDTRTSHSYLRQGDHFNINNPETGFPDQNLVNSGKGNEQKSTSAEFWPDLQEILQLISIREPEITSKSINTDPSYYFIDNTIISDNILNQDKSKLNAELIRKDFPILQERINGKEIVWFDNAATTHKPKSVIDRISYFYEHENSNIHRAAHELAARATDAYEEAREKVRNFLGAKSANEIVFVRGATEAINLVAQSWGEQHLSAGDEIIVSNLEHHANIVPWKRLADKKGAKLLVIPVNDDGEILLGEYTKLLSPKTKLVAVTQVSNALGTVTPVEQITALAHHAGARVLIDGAQSVSHMPVNVQTINADWFVFSGHKVFGPTGIGVLYGKEELLNDTQPWQSGGNMIQDVTFEQIRYHNAPNRFEAGTGNIADAVGLGAAIDYVTKIGLATIGQYEHQLLEYATSQIRLIPGIRLIGTAREKASVLSFILQGYENDEVGKALNNEGIAVRTGHHCAQPILRRLGVETTVRPSLAFYNTRNDVDRFIDVLWQLKSKQ
jgi:cysteine desulfurase/selenocysteine lyase